MVGKYLEDQIIILEDGVSLESNQIGHVKTLFDEIIESSELELVSHEDFSDKFPHL